MAADIQETLAKIDQARLSRVKQVLAPVEAPEFDKDPNEYLVDLGKFDGKSLLADYHEEISHYATTPFDPDGNRIRLYPRGVTIWSGFPGVGKTTLLRELVCHLMQRDQNVFVASLEEHPKHVIVRLAQTAAGTINPNAHQVQWFLDRYGERLRIWAKVGLASHRNLLAVVRKLASEGTTHAIIDSLMKLDVSCKDIEEQRQFANLLTATAQQTGCHIHLVAHPKKPSQKGEDPDLNDIAGAKELGGEADNVIFIRRRDITGSANVTGMRIFIDKQRHGTGMTGHIDGFFQREYRQFSMEQFCLAKRYLPADAYTPVIPFRTHA